jgi:hypothetical protein
MCRLRGLIDQFNCRSNNPQDSTAYHLCSAVSSKAPELMVPYKLLAFCREYYHYSSFSTYVLYPVFVSFGSALNVWWSGNAKYVLPPINSEVERTRYDERDKTNSWEFFIEDAAAVWKEIAETWAIVRIPSYMDHNSSEFSEYQQIAKTLVEQSERKEYERLKKKFE